MDGKTELKILTETLLNVLEHHAKMLEAKIDPKVLPHQKVIDGLLSAIGKLPQRNQTASPVEAPKNLEVLEWGTNNKPQAPKVVDIEPSLPKAPEGPKSETIVPSIPEPQVLTGISERLDSPQAPKPLPTGDVTPETIDSFGELMADDSLLEPIIKPAS